MNKASAGEEFREGWGDSGIARRTAKSAFTPDAFSKAKSGQSPSGAVGKIRNGDQHEDCQGDLGAVCDDLDQFKFASNHYRDKCVRIRLKKGELTDCEVDCLTVSACSSTSKLGMLYRLVVPGCGGGLIIGRGSARAEG